MLEVTRKSTTRAAEGFSQDWHLQQHIAGRATTVHYRASIVTFTPFSQPPSFSTTALVT